MNVLEVRGLTKRYPAFTLNGVSFAVPEGAVMGFIGRNGAGKSTTLKSILGMVHPDGGEVKVFGMDYAANERAIRRELGVVRGGIDFYPKKKIRVITDVTRRFYDNWDEGKYRHYLNLFAIDEEKRVDQLSSGMKVKYMIALALSHNARLLILDEPTSGLDPLMQREFFSILRERNREGTTVFLSSHVLSEIQRNCRRAAIIREGRLIACDSVEALSKTNAKRVTVHGELDIEKLPGVRDIQPLDGGASFLFGGDINALVGQLAACRLTDLSVAEPDLEEIFLHYYTDGGETK